MAERERKQKPAPQKTDDKEVGDTAASEKGDKAEKGEKLKGELDDLLDEIDSVLESNAEDFVRSYVQKGGE